jgi:hypothetical protein
MLGNIFRIKKDAPTTAAALEAQTSRARKIAAAQQYQTARNIAAAEILLQAAARRA